jgi:energy-coupling factor transporter ATP-binding protein EcfA2
VRTHSAPKYWESDAYEMRHRYGICRLDIDEFTKDGKEPSRIVYPDLLIHEHDATRTESEGGTGALLTGKRGCGKSTLLSQIAIRLLDENDEIVIWRGSSMRSEWLRLKRWITLWLPEQAEHEADWMTEADDDRTGDVDDLDDVVRDVETYSDPVDLLEQLGDGPAGTINVVYPDPTFSGCTDLTAEFDRPGTTDPLPFRPSWECEEDVTPTPIQHWWFAFILAAIEHSSAYEWLSLLFDELGDLAPEDAKQDADRTFDKLTLFRSCLADSRRSGFSMFGAIHYEANLHHKGRREFEWRISMPDSRPNPRTSRRSSIPVGFETVPMRSDVISGFNVGTGLCYTEAGCTWFGWDDIPFEPADQGRWLRIQLREPDLPAGDAEASGLEFAYDDRIFAEWQNAHAHRLVVKDPGDGQVSVPEAEVLDELESPVPDLRFVGLVDVPGGRELVMDGPEGQITVARLPLDPVDGGLGGSSPGVNADD